MTRKVELLAPARNAEVAFAAIRNGADAVYMGGPAFGAREAAGNSMEDLARVVDYAHRFYCRVFLTLNTVLFDGELAAAERLAKEAYRMGVDALIVQDPGLLKLDLPPIALHASTQMHNYDLARIKFLDELGFQRIVLARELSLEQLREIRRTTRAELECFVHGALCVSLSGQCYISRYFTGRSANRGQCAQFCRMRWDVKDAAGRYLVRDKYALSLKDLNLSERLPELVEAGIDSFKIEGRLKEADYVANVTQYYSRRLDEIVANSRGELARVGSGRSEAFFEPDPARSFNRGFTEYFFAGRPAGLVNMDTPKSLGKRVGVARQAKGNRLVVDASEPIHNADGLCYFDGRELRGIKVNRAEGENLTCNERVDVRPGTALYRNYDHEFVTRLSRTPSVRRIGVAVEAWSEAGRLALEAVDEDGARAALTSGEAFPTAENPAQRERLLAQLRKCGGTDFVCSRAEWRGGEVLFVPAAAVNELRRRLLEALSAAREARRPRLAQPPLRAGVAYPLRADWRLNIANRLAADFYREHGVEAPEEGFELATRGAGTPLMTTRYCLLHELGLCRREGRDKGVRYPLTLANQFCELRLDFDCSHCLMTVNTVG